jgi:hypothetical protein
MTTDTKAGLKSLRVLNNGELIDVGDTIRCTMYGGLVWTKRVHRVTKTFVFIRFNEVAEGKFKRVFKSFGFRQIPAEKLDNRHYTILTTRP